MADEKKMLGETLWNEMIAPSMEPKPLTFDAAPKGIDIPATHKVGDDIILEEK